MLDILTQLKNKIFRSDYLDISPRKRRLSRELDNIQTKMRRLDDYLMPRSSSPIDDYDVPSSSKDVFKKPSFPRSRSKPNEIIDLSDDEDDLEIIPIRDVTKKNEWIDASLHRRRPWFKRNYLVQKNKSHEQMNNHLSIIRKAKATIQNCNNFLSTNIPFSRRPIESRVLNESFRMDDKERYKNLLDIFKPSSSLFSFRNLSSATKVSTDTDDRVFTFKGINGSVKKDSEKKTPFSERKRYDSSNNNVPTIDLTNDGSGSSKIKSIIIDSDSDSDVRIFSESSSSTKNDSSVKSKLSPVNSLKKRLEIEPVMNENWFSEWNNQYFRTIEEKKKQIEEERIRRDKIHEVNKQNVHLRLEEKLKSCLRLQEVILLDEEPEEQLVLPNLAEDHEKIITQVFKPGPGSQVFIEKFNLRITRNDLMTLRGLNWLNDEIINFYTNMIAERGNGSNPKLPRVHAMNTFFYPKIVSAGYSSVRRWTKRVDIFAQDMIVVPVHLGVHWCMSIIDFRDKTIRYFDSMGNENTKCLNVLYHYLKDEHKDKKKSDMDMSGWKSMNMKDIPQQMNGSDCGMFACMFAEFLTRNAKILFDQQHMPYFRKKMVYEIISGKLMMT